MFRKITLLLTIVLAIGLLSACSLDEQFETVQDRYIEPAISGTSGDSSAVVNDMEVDIYTDRSKLDEYAPTELLGSRQSLEPMLEILVGDYSRLMPFVGAYYTDESGNMGVKYGLVTMEGEVVIDPLLSTVRTAGYETDGEWVFYEVLILGVEVSGEMLYCLVGTAGDWATGFIYTDVFVNDMGVIGIVDEASNSAQCYNGAGDLVFDSSQFAELFRLKVGSIRSIEESSGGYMKIIYPDDREGYIDIEGSVLNSYSTEMPSYFQEALPFYDGMAAVKLGDEWNYMDDTGYYAIYGSFEEATNFVGGHAAVKFDGVWKIIDREGEPIAELTDAADVEMFESYVAVQDTTGTVKYYFLPSMEEINMYDLSLTFTDTGYWVKGAEGVRMRTFGGEEMYFSGAVSVDGRLGDYYLVTLLDGSQAVMDRHSRVVVHGDGLELVSDDVTGEVYVMTTDELGKNSLYDDQGLLVASDYVRTADTIEGKSSGPTDGMFMCADGSSSGWKTGRNEWSFRLLLDYVD